MMPRDTSGPSSERLYGDWWWPLLVSAAALAVAVVCAWVRPVWHDELFTLWLARMPVGDLLAALRVDSGPPLHYLLCHLLYLVVGWQEGSGLGTVMVRLPSAVAYAMLPWVVWSGTRQFRAARFWGPLLAASWLPMLYFATEARAYALLALVNAFVWLLGPAWIERGGRWTLLFAGVAASLPLLHYTGVVSIALLPGLAFFLDRSARRRLLLAVAGASLPILLWSPIMLGAPPQSMAWVDTTEGPGRPGLATLGVLAPAGPYPDLFEVAAVPVPPSASLLVLSGLLAGVVVGAVRRHRSARQGDLRETTAGRQALALLPAVVLSAGAMVQVPVYFAGRTESLVWGPAAALTAVLASNLSPIARRVLLGMYLAVSLATSALWTAGLSGRQPALGVEVGLRIAPLIEDGDRVVVVGLWQLEVRHGLTSAATDQMVIEVETLPSSQARHPGWLDREALFSAELPQDAQALELAARERASRVWLIWSPDPSIERDLLAVFEGWRRVRIAVDPMLAVELLTPPTRGEHE